MQRPSRLSGMHPLRGLGTAAVAGPSMAPTLSDGDLLLVRWRARVRVGDVVLGRFRALPHQLVVKRVVRQVDDGWWLLGDNTRLADDSRRYGVADIEAVVLLRYWPPPPGRPAAPAGQDGPHG